MSRSTVRRSILRLEVSRWMIGGAMARWLVSIKSSTSALPHSYSYPYSPSPPLFSASTHISDGVTKRKLVLYYDWVVYTMGFYQKNGVIALMLFSGFFLGEDYQGVLFGLCPFYIWAIGILMRGVSCLFFLLEDFLEMKIPHHPLLWFLVLRFLVLCALCL